MAEYDSHPQYAFELIDLINDYRASKGAQPLTIDHTLMDLSQNYTDFLKANGKFSHTADGQYPWTRIAKSGFVAEEGLSGSKIGNENLHYGYSSRDGYHDPQDALQGWINSSGHNRNMLNPEWDRVGIGYRDGLYTANFGDGPDQPTNGSPPTNPQTPDPEIPKPEPEPTAVKGSFGPSQTASYAAPDAGPLADFVTIRLGNVVDESGSTAQIRLEALLNDMVVGTTTANVPEPGGTINYNPGSAFDEVRITAGEPDVTGIVQDVDFTLLAKPAPAPKPEPTAAEGSFGPSKAATYEVSDGGRLADYATITLGNVVDENGSTALVRLEALLNDKVVGTATAKVREPGGTIKYNPSAAFDEVRIKAGESDVTGVVQKIDFSLLPEPAPAGGSGSGSGSTGVGEFEQRVIILTNAERAERGLAPLKSNAELNEAADRHAEDMAANKYFSHTGLDGDRAWDRAEELGYSSNGFGENIARGQQTPEAVVAAWMGSSGHRANILNAKFADIGVGYENDYWVQNFGTDDTNPDSLIS